MHGVELLRPAGGASARERTARGPRGLARWMKRIQKNAPMATAFFLLGIAQCLSVTPPFALCCLLAVRFAHLPLAGAAAGVAAGEAYRLLWGMPPDWGGVAACALCLALPGEQTEGKRRQALWTGAALLLRVLPGALTAQDTQTVLLSLIGAPLGLALMPGLRRCALLLRGGPQKWTEDDLLCLMLPAVLLTMGAARLTAFQMNVGYLLSACGALLACWTAGSAAGACVGMGCGLALVLGGESALYLVLLSLGALLGGLFQGKNRLLPALMYLLTGVTLTYLIVFSFQPTVFFASLAGGIAFALLPGKWVKRAAAWARAVKWSRPGENAYTRLKMQRWVRAIDRLADALPHPKEEQADREEEAGSLTEALCADCDRLPICWHERYEQTREAMLALAGRPEDAGEYLDLINRHFSCCPRISRIPPLLNRLDGERQRRKNRAVCAEYERDMLQTHLTALSQAAQRISLEGGWPDAEESYWIVQSDEALEALRFPGKTAFIKKTDGKMTVCLQGEPLALRPLDSLTLARQIGTYLNADLEVTERKNGRIMLEERPPLKVVTGMATACAVTLDKSRRAGQAPDNGDAVLIEPLSGGREVLALSDGMGHGAGAQDESRKTLEMLSLCLEAGYTRAQAMTVVNGAMLSRTGGERFATVDLCLIDLWTGEAVMNKLGACSSILAQGQKVCFIQGEALPLGIIERVTPMEHRVVLGEGDLLLMMSDGVTDAFPSDGDLLRIVRDGRLESPQHLADALLREAMLQRDGLPPDDMTVLCARVAARKAD